MRKQMIWKVGFNLFFDPTDPEYIYVIADDIHSAVERAAEAFVEYKVDEADPQVYKRPPYWSHRAVSVERHTEVYTEGQGS